MDLRASYQKLVTKVTDLENEKADIQSELEQVRLLAKYKKTDFTKERDELQAEITELQMLVEDLRAQVGRPLSKTNCGRFAHVSFNSFLRLWLFRSRGSVTDF